MPYERHETLTYFGHRRKFSSLLRFPHKRSFFSCVDTVCTSTLQPDTGMFRRKTFYRHKSFIFGAKFDTKKSRFSCLKHDQEMEWNYDILRAFWNTKKTMANQNDRWTLTNFFFSRKSLPTINIKSRPKVLKEPRIDTSVFAISLVSPIVAIVVVLVEGAIEDASTHHGVFRKKGIQGRQW